MRFSTLLEELNISSNQRVYLNKYVKNRNNKKLCNCPVILGEQFEDGKNTAVIDLS